MKQQIEVEVRGKIKQDFNSVLKKFHDKTKFIKEKNRFSLIYFRGDKVRNVAEIKDEEVDLKLRATNKKAEMAIKYGKWGGT